MDHDPELDDKIEALYTLSHMGYFDSKSAAFGIAKQWLHEGEESLSSKQLFLLKKEIEPIIAKKCGACNEGIELSALPDAYEQNKMLCSKHMYQLLKDD